MTDQELLQAMSDMLKPILAEMQEAKEKLNEIDKRVDTIEKRVDTIDKRVDTIDKKVDTIDKKVDRNYDLTLEFYGRQKEHNTEVSDTLDIFSGEMEMHNNQIAKNTAALKRYK